MKNILYSLTLNLCLLFLAVNVHAQQEAPANILRFAVDPGFAPFEMMDQDGTFKGVAGEFLQQISDLSGYTFEFVPTASWEESLDLMKTGDVDILPCIGYHRDRLDFLQYSDAYLEFARILITTRDNLDLDLDHLNDLTLGAQRDSSHHGHLIEAGIDAQYFDTFGQALLALSAGELDVVVGNLATTMHTIQNLSLTNLRIAGALGDETFTLHIGVRKGLVEELEAINRALSKISPKTRNTILDTWFPLPLAPKKDLLLNREEQEWLLSHPRIRVGWDPGWAPVEFLSDEGYPQGISIEYLHALEDILGINFIFEPPRPWTETLQLIQQGEIDILSCVGKSSAREAYMDLTQSYFEGKAVIFTREENPYVLDLNHLKDRKIAVLADYTLTHMIEDAYPDIRLEYVDTVEAAFEALQAGAVTAYVGSLLTGNYYLSKIRPHDIKIAGETDLKIKLHIGVRKGLGPLTQLLNKALAQIPEQDRIAFYRKWMWVRYDKSVDTGLLMKVALLGLAGVLLFVSWNRRLANEVTRRKKAEHNLVEKRKEIEAQYTELQKLEQLKDNLIHMVIHDMRSPLTVIQGALDLLQDQVKNGEPLDQQSFDWLNKAEVSSGAVIQMVTDLLDVSRLETGKMPVRAVSASLKEEAERVVRSLSPVVHQYNIQIDVQGVDAEARFDVSLIRRVLNNLISNAIKACGQEGEISLRVSETPASVRVEVQDNGRGIKQQDIHRVFEKFIQADGTHDTSRANSSGLGLAFCQLTLQAHKGQIGVHSEYGTGSVFWFELPKP